MIALGAEEDARIQSFVSRSLRVGAWRRASRAILDGDTALDTGWLRFPPPPLPGIMKSCQVKTKGDVKETGR